VVLGVLKELVVRAFVYFCLKTRRVEQSREHTEQYRKEKNEREQNRREKG